MADRKTTDEKSAKTKTSGMKTVAAKVKAAKPVADMKPLDKVVNLGLPKSGTTTLGQALTHAGYRVADWRVRTPGKKGYVGAMLYNSYFAGKDPWAPFEDFDALSQMDIVRDGKNFWPQCDYGLLMAIREYHPTVKFILSHREPKALSDSMQRWSDLGRRRLKVHEIPGLPLGYGKRDIHRIKWIEGHYKFVRKVFEGDEHFLEYDVTDVDAPKKIGAFLGRELPWWGRANEGKQRSGEAAEVAKVAVEKVEAQA